MIRVIQFIDSFTRRIGLAVRWLSLLMVLASCGVVALRYLFDTPSIALQESVTYLHASLFMLGAAYTWQQGGHVRVDVFYRGWPNSRRQWVDRLGVMILVIPTCLFLLWVSWEYVANAWAIKEQSAEASGLPFIYILKSLILALPLTILLQAIAELLRTFTADTQQRTEESDHG